MEWDFNQRGLNPSINGLCISRQWTVNVERGHFGNFEGNMCVDLIGTLCLFNIAMENGPFRDDFPIKTSIYKGFSMAMLNNQTVCVLLCWILVCEGIQIIQSKVLPHQDGFLS